MRALLRQSLIAAQILLAATSAFAERAPVTVDKLKSEIAAEFRIKGPLSLFSREHAISPKSWFANLRMDPARLKDSYVEVTVSTLEWEVDSQAGRMLFELKGDPLGTDDAKRVQEAFVGPAMLDVQKHQRIRFESTSVEPGEKGQAIVKGSLTLRDKSLPIEIPVLFRQLEDGRYFFGGSFEVRLSDFGMKPPSPGTLKSVDDRVRIRFSWVSKAERLFASAE